MALISLVDCPNDNLKMYNTIALIVSGHEFGTIAYNSINLRVSCHAAAGADPSSGSFCCMGLTGYVGLIRH